MQVIAQLKNFRVAPRKVRLVSKFLKGADALTAKYKLDHLAKKSSNPISKLLDSALANAHNNFGLAKDNLFIKEILVDEGPKLKRFRPKGFGSTSPLEKKTSNIRIVLEEKVPGLKANKEEAKHARKEPESTEAEETQMTEKKTQAKPEIKKELGKKNLIGKIGKRMFQRKTI
jgi:large subunit ribosomal protein L22